MVWVTFKQINMSAHGLTLNTTQRVGYYFFIIKCKFHYTKCARILKRREYQPTQVKPENLGKCAFRFTILFILFYLAIYLVF